jgi:type I restriction enzyme S subunit
MIASQKANRGQGDAVVHISARQLGNIKIPIPVSFKEQTTIATALDDIDTLITSLEKIIEKKLNIKQGATQKLLDPKDDWEKITLGEIVFSVSSGRSKTQSTEGEYPIYGSTGIIGRSNYYDYKGERILLARVGANAGTVNKVAGQYNVSDNTIMISFNGNVDIDFAYFKLINYKLNNIVFGSGQPLITGSQLKQLEFPIPSKPMQMTISKVLNDIDFEIKALETKLEKTKLIKKGMMQNLLTGKIRLV